MPGQFYDNPVEVSYRFAAAAVSTGTVLGRFIGPVGKTGRVRSFTSIVTTTLTGTVAAVLDIDTVAGVTTPVTLTIAADETANAGDSATRASIAAQSDLPADTVVQVSTDGGPTLGNADLTVSVGWF